MSSLDAFFVTVDGCAFLKIHLCRISYTTNKLTTNYKNCLISSFVLLIYIFCEVTGDILFVWTRFPRHKLDLKSLIATENSLAKNCGWNYVDSMQVEYRAY